MKIKLFSIILIFFLSIHSWSQTSLEAKYLLEKTSKKLDNYVSFELEFNYVLNNQIEQINQESSGKVTVAGDKYKLNFLDVIQLFDGKNIYTIVPENEEITLIKSTDDAPHSSDVPSRTSITVRNIEPVIPPYQIAFLRLKPAHS